MAPRRERGVGRIIRKLDKRMMRLEPLDAVFDLRGWGKMHKGGQRGFGVCMR
jgi:hypothetical protein